MLDPNTIDKYLYITKTPTWKVRLLFGFGLLSWILVIIGYSGAFVFDPFYRWFVAPIVLFTTIYYLFYFLINFHYKKPSIDDHKRLLKTYWKQFSYPPIDLYKIDDQYPSIDVYLPVCGEDLKLVKNNWWFVSQLWYPNKKIYVLDDSNKNNEEYQRLAKLYGFNYIERPNKGEGKKAGNLKHALELTNGEFIIVFDADFAPKKDFIYEMLPYIEDQKVSIVQSPQYFVPDQAMNAVEYRSVYEVEIFYRVVQVARDKLGGAICVGTNAIYRRKALESIGGFRQVVASEDSRTGFATVSKGWKIKYVPLLLAVGTPPDTIYGYFHQQHRWSRGSTELVFSKEFLNSSASWSAKASIISGMLMYWSHPISIIFSFHIFYTLFMYHDYISFKNGLIFYPFMIFAFVLQPWFLLVKFKFRIWSVTALKSFAISHSVLSTLIGAKIDWIATNAKHNTVSPAFQQTMNGVRLYVIANSMLIFCLLFIGYIHLFDINYYTVQFWMFNNLLLSIYIFWQMRKFYKSTQQENRLSDKAQPIKTIVAQKQIQYVN